MSLGFYMAMARNGREFFITRYRSISYTLDTEYKRDLGERVAY